RAGDGGGAGGTGLSSAGTGGEGSGGSAGGSSSGGAASGGGGTLGGNTASQAAPGVTGTTIYVGVIYTENGKAANEAIGAAGITQGDEQANVRVLVDDINAHGGVAGRK